MNVGKVRAPHIISLLGKKSGLRHSNAMLHRKFAQVCVCVCLYQHTIPGVCIGGVEAISDGQPATKQSGAGRGAQRVGGVEGGQEEALCCHGVQVGGLFGRVAIHTQVSPAHLQPVVCAEHSLLFPYKNEYIYYIYTTQFFLHNYTSTAETSPSHFLKHLAGMQLAIYLASLTMQQSLHLLLFPYKNEYIYIYTGHSFLHIHNYIGDHVGMSCVSIACTMTEKMSEN